MNNRYIIPLVFVALALYFGVSWLLARQKEPIITTFEECAAAGNPVRETYPEQCVANGKTFVRVVDGTSTTTPPTGEYEVLSPDVRLKNPHSNAIVTSPLVVSGDARGTWYFEASFPVRLLDGNGKEIARVPAQAQSDWMTENFVPFVATLTFVPPATATGTLVLEKDNPSGLPANAGEVRIPVVFASGVPVTKGTSGIRGTVTVGPTCPVERIPPDPACADRSLAVRLVAVDAKGKVAAHFVSDAKGKFEVTLPAGVYMIEKEDKTMMFPSFRSTQVSVSASTFTEVNLSFDTGIR